MEGLAVLLGIDALIDPIRTSVNVASHCAAPAVVARWEGHGTAVRAGRPSLNALAVGLRRL